jgi:hypothetical protein
VTVVSAGRHPKKEIADALRRTHEAGLAVVEIHRGHRWGEVVCDRCDESRAVWSTPKSPGLHAKAVDRFVQNHIHG